MMVEVKIDSVRVSLMSQHRIVVLRAGDSTPFLPIWIGPFEADAIIMELQGVEVARPLTHDLLKNAMEKLGAEIERVAITKLRDDTFYAELIVLVNGRRMAIDSRPSDAIALAVRAHVPIYVSDDVLEQAGVTPEPDLEGAAVGEPADSTAQVAAPEAFRDFLAGLDLTGFE
ncbi:MAG: bifunctional nuclease family protein [Chloroflexi bacterium]|nr:bifunctional nuclease family protein [Chloroflexota bacterium]